MSSLYANRLKEEFALHKYKLEFHNDKEKDLFQTSDVINYQYWLGFRAFTSIYFLTIFFWSMINFGVSYPDSFGIYFCYLTHWNVIINLLYISSAGYLVYKRHLNHEIHVFLYKFTWVTMNVSFPICALVFVLFWGLVFDGAISALTLQVHGINFLILLVDFHLNNATLRILHAIYPFIIILCYVFFSIMYAIGGGVDQWGRHYLYSALNWIDNPSGTAILVTFIVLIGFPITYFLLWNFSNIKKFKMNQGKSEEQDLVQIELHNSPPN